MHRVAAVVLAGGLSISCAWGQQAAPAVAAIPASPAPLLSSPRPSTQKTGLPDLLRLARNLNSPPPSAQDAAGVPQSEPAQAQPAAPAEAPAGVQLVQPGSPGQTGPPVTITLQDAIARASKNYAQYLSAVTDAQIANEDRVQARAAMLPSLSYTQQ